jgi:hypothetical protein
LLVHRKGRAEPDDLAHLVPQLDLDGFPFAHDAHVGPPQFTKKIQGRLRLLAQGQLEGVLPTPVFQRLVHIPGHAVKPLRRTLPFDPLVGPLVVVIPDPMVEALAGVGKRGKDRLREEFGPNRFPEALDLAQGHGMVGGGADMLDPLPLELFLERRLAPPGGELAPVVGEDLPGCPPLPDGPLDHLQHRLRRLLAVQAVPHQVPAVVVDHPHQVHRVHPLELEGEDVDLP